MSTAVWCDSHALIAIKDPEAAVLMATELAGRLQGMLARLAKAGALFSRWLRDNHVKLQAS